MATRPIEIGQAGTALAENIAELKKLQRLSFNAMSERLSAIGRPIAPLGLRRIVHRQRRVDVDDLMALAQVFGISVRTLMDGDWCGVCYGAPPPGFTCNACAAGDR